MRRRPSPSRPRFQRTIARTCTLPDLGLSCSQLAALANTSEGRVLACARELDADVEHSDAILSPALVELVAEELALSVAFKPQTVPLIPDVAKSSQNLSNRMPVVTVMGHVDHGKTSLLDALRSSDVAKHEHGGITQSVAAFRVPIPSKAANGGPDNNTFTTFIDTPGHAAFRTMRENGSVATDIIVLVVAANDGVMPQTIEVANLARAANVPVIIAINKCDVEGANPDRVRFQLLQQVELNSEQLGGSVLCVDISAKTGHGLSDLLDAISLQGEMLELRSDASAPARAICLESRTDRSLGGISTIVVRSGVIRKGDFVAFQNPRALSGQFYGRARLLLQSDGQEVAEAGPGLAVGLVGIRESIPPGSELCVMKDEKSAKVASQQVIARNSDAVQTLTLANSMVRVREERLKKAREERKRMNGLDEGVVADVETDVEDDAQGGGNKKRLFVTVKADVKGSGDAVAQCVQRLGRGEVDVRVMQIGLGDVTDVDVSMAAAPKRLKNCVDESVIVAFNVKVKGGARKTARSPKVDILEHSVIYHLEDEMKAKVESLDHSSIVQEIIRGRADVVRVFEDGAIAGSTIRDGVVSVGDIAKVMRGDVGGGDRQQVFSGGVASIRQFANPVQSITKGSECGIGLIDWSEFRPGDEIVFTKEGNPDKS